MIDPWHIHLSKHTVDRYMERRGWASSYAYRQDAEHAIRNLLARCARQNPPLRVMRGQTGRLFKQGEFTFVVNADNTVVITCYGSPMNAHAKRKRRAKSERASREWASR